MKHWMSCSPFPQDAGAGVGDGPKRGGRAGGRFFTSGVNVLDQGVFWDTLLLTLVVGYVWGAVGLGWLAGRDWYRYIRFATDGFLLGGGLWILASIQLARVGIFWKRPGRLFRFFVLAWLCAGPVVGLRLYVHVQSLSRKALIGGLDHEELRRICVSLMDRRGPHGVGTGGPWDPESEIREKISQIRPRAVEVERDSVTLELAGSGMRGYWEGIEVYRPGRERRDVYITRRGRRRKVAEGVYAHHRTDMDSGLSQIRAKRIARALEEAAETGHRDVQEAAGRMQVDLSPDSIAAFLRAGGGRWGTEHAPLRALLLDPGGRLDRGPYPETETPYQDMLIEAFRRVPDGSYADAIAEFLEEYSSRTRGAAAEILAVLGAKSHVPSIAAALEGSLGDPYRADEVRAYAHALAGLTGESWGDDPQQALEWWRRQR